MQLFVKNKHFFCSNNVHSFDIMFSFHLTVIFMLEGIPRIARVERYAEYVMATNGYVAPEYVMIGMTFVFQICSNCKKNGNYNFQQNMNVNKTFMYSYFVTHISQGENCWMDQER